MRILQFPSFRDSFGLPFFCAVALAVPAVLTGQTVTLAQFERDVKQVAEHVNNIVDAEFEHLEEALTELQKPLAVGDTVTVDIRRGNARETIEGRFNGIVGNYLRISSNSILLSDVAEEERDRFIIAQNPERRKDIIAARQAKIEESKEHQRRKLRPTILREAGYGPAFFDDHLQLGDRIFRQEELGASKIIAVLTAVETEEQILCRVYNRANLKVAAVAMLADQGVGASTTADVPDAPWGKEFSFYLPRARFTNLTNFLNDFKVQCYSSGAGVWQLSAKPQTKRKTSVTQHNGVPTKVHQIMIAFQLDDYQRGDMLAGKLASVPEISLETYRRHLAEASVLQERLADQRAVSEAKAKAESLAREKASAEAIAAALVTSPGTAPAPAFNSDVAQAVIDELAAAQISFGSLTTDETSKPGTVSNAVRPIANHLAPKAVDNVAIYRASPWQRLVSRTIPDSRALDFSQYRLLVGNRGDDPVVIMQLSGVFASSLPAISTHVATAIFGDGDDAATLTTEFTTPPDYVGKVFLYFPIELDLAKKSIKSAQIGIKQINR